MPFDPAYASSLDNPLRRKALPPRRILSHIISLHVKRNVAVDVGAGAGYLTIPLSWVFKKVYAIEANPKMARILEGNLRGRGMENVEVLLAEKPPTLPMRPNLVAFSLSLHEISDREAYLEWARASDYVLVIEWMREKTRGPPVHERISKEELLKLARGYELVLSRDYWPYYLIILKPKRI